MPKWIENLRGLNVIVTGDFRPRLSMNRSDLQALLRKHGACVDDDVRRSTDLLIRADSPMWLYGEYGQREAELAENGRLGHDVGVIDVDGLVKLLSGEGVWTRAPLFPPATTDPVGQRYLSARASSDGLMPVVIEHDPAALERALASHATVQNTLAAFVESQGFEPLSPAGSAAQFDLAWTVGDAIWVAEIKSTTGQNESTQLRLGLGQVLEYSWRLSQWHKRAVRPVLVPEQRPVDDSWGAISAECGVLLTWPDSFESLRSALAQS